MKKGVLLVLVLAMLATLLGGCSSAAKPTLRLYQWADYIDESLLPEFEKEFNCNVKVEYFSSNEDMYVKVKSNPSAYDLTVPSEYMVERMMNEGLLAELNHDNIPNLKYIMPKFNEMPIDSERKYSVPYLWGTMGFVYDPEKTDFPGDSWGVLFENTYDKDMLMLDQVRDDIGAALLYLGYDINTQDKAQIDEAKELLKAQKPHVLAYVVEDVQDKMVAGEASVAMCWSGDAMIMQETRPELEYVIPKEGTNMWWDSFVILKDSPNKELAEKFINFMNEPDNAVRNALEAGYAAAHTSVPDGSPEWMKGDPCAYPTEEMMESFVVMRDTSKELLQYYDDAWMEIKMGN